MTIIKPLLSYSKSIYGGVKKSSEIKETKTESPKAEDLSLAQQTKTVSADEVFKFMSQTSQNIVKPTKTVNVKAYVSTESSTRISDSVNQFEKMFNKTLNVIKTEFGDILSEDAMSTLTLQLLT